MDPNDGYLTPEETAELLKLNVETIYRLLRTGKLVGAKIGDSWRIRRSDIDKYFDK